MSIPCPHTYRFPLRERGASLLLVLVCALILGYAVAYPSRRPGRLPRDIAFGVLMTGVLAGAVCRAWRTSTAILILDEQGVRWRIAMLRHELGWDEIEGLKVHPGTSVARWALVEKGTGVCHVLPFMPRALFLAFKERSRILSPEAGEGPSG